MKIIIQYQIKQVDYMSSQNSINLFIKKISTMVGPLENKRIFNSPIDSKDLEFCY